MKTAFHASRLCAGLDGEAITCGTAEKGSLPAEDAGAAHVLLI
jgi:hypothetical protein